MRTLLDADGVFWQVESVYPYVDLPHPQYDEGQELPGEELFGVRVSPIVGWLSFTSSAGTRRRLTPVPGGWETATNEQLARYCEAATPLGPAKHD